MSQDCATFETILATSFERILTFGVLPEPRFAHCLKNVLSLTTTPTVETILARSFS